MGSLLCKCVGGANEGESVFCAATDGQALHAPLQSDLERASRETTVAECTRAWRAARDINKVCSICLDAVEANDELMTLPCFHVFHERCGLAWLIRNENMTCPHCNVRIHAPAPPMIASSNF